jgi:hypothetical protein
MHGFQQRNYGNGGSSIMKSGFSCGQKDRLSFHPPVPLVQSFPCIRFLEEHLMKHDDLSGRVIGCFLTAYNELGFGFPEAVYAAALQILRARSPSSLPTCGRRRRISAFCCSSAPRRRSSASSSDDQSSVVRPLRRSGAFPPALQHFTFRRRSIIIDRFVPYCEGRPSGIRRLTGRRFVLHRGGDP